jgi:hypothetical protein
MEMQGFERHSLHESRVRDDWIRIVRLQSTWQFPIKRSDSSALPPREYNSAKYRRNQKRGLGVIAYAIFQAIFPCHSTVATAIERFAHRSSGLFIGVVYGVGSSARNLAHRVGGVSYVFCDALRR